MSLISKIIKPILIILIITLIGVIGLFGYGFQSAKSEGTTFKFAGWIWSENYGWFSLNSDNCQLLDPSACISNGQDYGVKIDAGNNITGYAWSENVGWVCFGDDCTNNSSECPGTVPDNDPTNPGSDPTKLDGTTGKISGWAKICALGNDGWIKFRRGETAGSIPPGTGEACYDCKTVCLVWTGDCVDPDGVNCFNGATCDDANPANNPENCENITCTIEDLQCNTCFAQTNFSGTDYPTDPQDPNAKKFVVGGSSYLYTACKKCTIESGRTTCDDCQADVGTSLELYGVNRNLSDGRLLGWAWNGDNSGLIGAGWLHFNPKFGNSYIVFPWLQTLYGSIYTPNWVKQKAGVEGRNATYCIVAQDINANVKSQNCEDLVQGVEVGSLENNSNGIYRNALGKIDVTGMIRTTTGTRNKYGQTVINFNNINWSDPEGVALNGSVYYFDGNLEINTPIRFENTSANTLGNGIIVVNGNLTIGEDIIYLSATPTKLNQLASVVWIVKGDVIINPNVENVAGAFMVLGNGNTCTKLEPLPDPDYHKYIKNGCGVFFSGESNNPLTVLGLVVAKAFDFGRTFAEILQGSERIIYDGRLTANPPKALSGFVAGLPVIRDFSY